MDSKVAGVCGGVAEYFGADSTIVRLLWVVVTFFTGLVPGIAVYLIGWIIMPLAPLPVPVQPAAQVSETPRASA